MSDPAVEAAERAAATAECTGRIGLAIAAAREALAPIRALHKPIRHPKFTAWSDEDFATLPRHLQALVCAECIHPVSGTNTNWPCPTARLVYTTYELENR